MKVNLKDIPHIIISVIAILTISSCQKVINVDLNVAEPRIVIEGSLNDRRGPYTVTISKSGSYFNQPVLALVSGAVVFIADDMGITDTLHEEVAGVYLTSKIRGIPGRTYTLKVMSEDKEYTGSSLLSSHVNIDSLTLIKNDSQRIFSGGNNPNETHYEIHCFFKDPPEKNFYRVKVFKNDSINTENYRLYDDQYTNGEETELRVVGRVEAGSTYRIELESLDDKTYGYYRTLSDLIFTNPFFGSTPANPNSNLSNGALGYFGTYAVSGRTMNVPANLGK